MSKPPRPESPGLTQFLADDVRASYYADLLLERAEAAGQGKPAPSASGNAYNVTFGPEEVVIEHHHLEDWPPVRISRKDFVTALKNWRAQWT
jgi:hypothetical protein